MRVSATLHRAGTGTLTAPTASFRAERHPSETQCSRPSFERSTDGVWLRVGVYWQGTGLSMLLGFFPLARPGCAFGNDSRETHMGGFMAGSARVQSLAIAMGLSCMAAFVSAHVPL